MKDNMRQQAEKRTVGRILARGIRILGVALLAALVAVCIPLTVPRFFGYQIYSVISGSMEPAIPVGSLVYIQAVQPGDIKEKDVIAFYGARDSASIITHRVVENRVLMGEFITRGDANQTEDMNPIPYDYYIGKVTRSVPGAGRVAEIFTSRQGKTAAAGVILAAVLLQILASLLEWNPKAGKKAEERHNDGRE